MRKFKLTKEFILFSLEKFRDMDRTDRECQKKLIETFVNSIFLYDDKVTITFNYSSDRNTVTLTDIKKACASEQCVRTCMPRQGREGSVRTILLYWFLNVFAIDVKIPISR